MHKVGIIGDKYSILGFKALGVSAYTAADGKEAGTVLEKLTEKGYALVFITEGLAAECAAAIERYGSAGVPAVVVIPGRQGSLGIGRMALRRAVERAVGVDILFRDT